MCSEVACGTFTEGIEDFALAYNALKIEGDIFMEFKDFKSSLQAYRRLKNFCDDRKKYREKIICYGQIGHIYTVLDDHNSAIKYFHK